MSTRGTMKTPFLLVLLVFAAGCSSPDGPSSEIKGLPRPLTKAEADLVRADNAFAFNLLRAIASSASPDSNVFISPLSAAMALGMAYNGAAGVTLTEMQHTLGFDGMTLAEVNQSSRSLIDLLRAVDRQVVFNLANSVWYQAGLPMRPEFLSATRTYFDATVESLNFSAPTAAPTINSWVNDKTSGKIPTIVPDPMPPDVVAYLINAIYFKGTWTAQFDAGLTSSAPFSLRTGSSTTVPMMRYKGEMPVRVLVDGGVTIIDLPYGGKAFSMTIALPFAPGGIDSLVPALSGESWNRWTATLDATGDGAAAIVHLPKFKLAYGLVMNGVLSALGMPSAFRSESADFTRMTTLPAGQLWISAVRHKATVDVNEEGTEAAAVTAVEVTTKGTGPLVFRIDHPFVFVIRERFSGAILFMGRVMNPVVN